MNSFEFFSTSTTTSRGAMEGSSTISSNNNNINFSSSSNSSNTRRTSRDMESLSLEMSKYPEDLFRRFSPPVPNRHRQPIGKQTDQEAEEDVELSLGLSLDGKFGVDKSHKGLIRSSSIAGPFPLLKDDDTAPAPPPAVSPIGRTASLPIVSDDDWKRKKELQMLRRLAAKRRRSEKQKSFSKESAGGGVCGGGGGEDAKFNLNVGAGRIMEKEHQFTGGLENKLNSSRASSLGSNHFVPAAGAGGSQGGGGGVGDVELRKRSFFSSLQGLLAQQGSQGSGESQGCTSSGASDAEIKSVQGSNESRSPASIHSQEKGTHEVTCPRAQNQDPLSKQPDAANNKRREVGASAVDDMPCVFTIGDPPNGRKVEGILYKYGKGEEVRIMCVCHGSFFSPAEFVKHAGGNDVEHPLRHIVVNPTGPHFQ